MRGGHTLCMKQHSLPKHTIVTKQLYGGARLVYVRIPKSSLSAVSVWFQVGSRFDPPGKEGLAHFLEHLYMGRTARFPKKIDKLQSLESKGIYTNAYTNYETAHFYHIQARELLFDSLDMLLDGMFHARISSADVQREKNIIVVERQRTLGSPFDYTTNLSCGVVWPKSALGRPFFGTEKTIRSITLFDIQAFQEHFYIPENATFVIVGDVSARILGEYMNAYLQRFSRTKSKSTFTPAPDDFSYGPLRTYLEKAKDPRVQIGLHYQGSSLQNRDWVVLDFIRDYLTNQWISKLMIALRLRHDFTYWVDGHTTHFSDVGLIRFLYTTDKQNVRGSIRMSFRVIENVTASLQRTSQLRAHKTAFVASFLRNTQDIYDVLWWYGWQGALAPSVISMEEYLEDVRSLTPRHIRSVAKRYLRAENRSITLLGNFDQTVLNFLKEM